ncbi:MAG: NAD(+) kinase [Abyssibacter sp.]|uniref:NAD(+) kinase n=1 Tax=Abyssibacter sp. TaxID=2320200 RepID=UPI002EAD7AAA|nr:NAD(+) kinase [Pseudomonadota bacterium]
MSEFRHIGIIAKRDDAAVLTTVERLARYLLERGLLIYPDPVAAPVTEATPVSRAEMGPHCDLCIVVGGDGTLLDAGRYMAPHDVPIVGVNRGRLGFMVDVSPDDMSARLDEILDGQGIREDRLMIEAQPDVQGDPIKRFLALNDVVVRNRAFARLLEFDTRINGEFVTRHRADGIVISTPTGSTAYALSSGGPIVHTGIDALTLVPICPHTLSDRPLVINANSELEVVVHGDNTEALVTWDGQVSHPLAGGDRIRIRASDKRMTLIHPPGYDYFHILRSKLHWGRGQA